MDVGEAIAKIRTALVEVQTSGQQVVAIPSPTGVLASCGARGAA